MKSLYKRNRSRGSDSRSNVGKSPWSGRGPVKSQTTQEVTPAPVRKQKSVPEGAFLKLMPELQRALGEEGYCQPTPIQTQAIPSIVEGRDIIGCAQTGTGKTAAFTLPILQFLSGEGFKKVDNMRPRVLVLAPTRELAAQIGDSIESYGRHLNLRHSVIFGGVGANPQITALKRGVDIVVATPGRLLDLMQQKCAFLDRVEFFVLDEADRMLDMGFIHDIRKIMKRLPAKRQTLFFSATMENEIGKLAKSLVNDPVYITIEPDKPAVELIDQKLYYVDKKKKKNLLCRLAEDSRMSRVIVFTQMKHSANKLVKELNNAGIESEAIHGNKSQSVRTRALDGFKKGHVRFLVATDIAARGIDVDNVSHVVNYDIPVEPETYVHRIGRTARAGKGGVAYSFCSSEEREGLRDIERLLRKEIPLIADHPFHSVAARNATGADARPPPKRQGGRGGRGRSNSSRDSRGRKSEKGSQKKSYFARSRSKY